jgi:hypothetical protein
MNVFCKDAVVDNAIDSEYMYFNFKLPEPMSLRSNAAANRT